MWRLTGFYRHPEFGQRVHSWNLLRRLGGMYSMLWICLGDFNAIAFDNEKLGGGIGDEY